MAITAPLQVTERDGTGTQPYLLVHGSMDRASSFGRVIASLGDDAPIVAYDRRGYAGSAGRAPSSCFDDQVGDLVEVLAGRRVIALGHSFGGDVVLAAAAAHPELFSAAVVWEPPMPWLEWWPASTAGSRAVAHAGDPADAAERFMVRMLGQEVWQRLPPSTRARRRAEGPALVAEMQSIRQAPWDPAEVAIPVIVGCGRESHPHHLRATNELAERLPLGTLRTVPGARHGAHLSHPTQLAGLLREVTGWSGAALGTGGPDAPESGARPAEEDPT